MVWEGLFLVLLVLITGRLRHLGWERCCHGLTSRPRESASAPFLDQLLSLFHYPAGSSAALLDGTLLLRYCSFKFAAKVPFWVLPVPGLLTVHDQVAASGVQVVGHGFGSRRKRFRLNRKTPAHLVGHSLHTRPRVWNRLVLILGGVGVISMLVVPVLFFPRTGVG